MKFTQYLKENCYFWMNTIVLVFFFSSIYILVEELYNSFYYFFAILGLIYISLIYFYFDEYINQLKNTKVYILDNWVFLSNCFLVFLILFSILLFFNGAIIYEGEIQYWSYILLIGFSIYVFLFLRNMSTFIKDYKKNGIKYFIFLLFVIVVIWNISYFYLKYLIPAQDYQGIMYDFAIFISIVNILFICFTFLPFLLIYLYILYKKLGILVKRVIFQKSWFVIYMWRFNS